MTAFASNLRRIRESRGLTATRVARALGLSQNTISQYELGAREPNIVTIKRLADFFNVSTDTLFEGVAEAPRVIRQSLKAPWEKIGFDVIDIDDQYIRIEPSPELAAVGERAPLEMTRATFGKLTRTMLEESARRYPDQSMAENQFALWAAVMTSPESARRRADPFKAINAFVPLEMFPPDLWAPADRRASTEKQKASA